VSIFLNFSKLQSRFFVFICLLTILLFLSGFFIIVTALPLAYATLKEGRRFGIGATLISFLILILLYKGLIPILGGHAQLQWLPLLLSLPGFGLLEIYGPSAVLGVGILCFIYYLVLSWAMVVAAGQRWSVEKTYLFLTAGPLLFCVGIVILFSGAYGFDIFVETQKYLLYIQDKLVNLDQKSGLSGDELVFLKQFGQEMIHHVVILLPVIILNMTLFIVWCNLFVARRWIKGLLAFENFGDLTCWQLKDQWIWALIGSLGLLFANAYFLKFPTVTFLASNVLFFVLFLYFFQGLSIVAYYLKKRGSLLLKVSLYLVIFIFFQLSIVVIIVMGVFDLWVDFRKLRRIQTVKEKV